MYSVNHLQHGQPQTNDVNSLFPRPQKKVLDEMKDFADKVNKLNMERLQQQTNKAKPAPPPKGETAGDAAPPRVLQWPQAHAAP